MLALGLLLVAAGAAALLVGLFSDNAHYIGWSLGTHAALTIGVLSGIAIMVGLPLIRWGTVRGVKNAIQQRKFEKRAKEAQD
jgi:hypothetical protein